MYHRMVIAGSNVMVPCPPIALANVIFKNVASEYLQLVVNGMEQHQMHEWSNTTMYLSLFRDKLIFMVINPHENSNCVT